MMSKKIAFFIDSLSCGGAEKSLVSLLQNLDYTKVEVSLFLFADVTTLKHLIPNQVRLIIINKTHNRAFELICKFIYSVSFRFLKLFRIKKNLAELQWSIQRYCYSKIKNEFDVAVAYQQGFPTYFVANKVNAPIKIAWVNTDLTCDNLRASYNKPYYNRYNSIVLVSQMLYDKHIKSNYFESTKLITIYDTINRDIILKQSIIINPIIEKIRNNSKYDVSLITVGRLSPEKNYPLAIQSAKILKENGLNFLWLFVGDGQERLKLETLVKSLKLDKEIIFVGYQENPFNFMKFADIYVHTSLYEGFGLTIAEALILGKPVVSTDFPVVHDQIIHGFNGLISKMDPNDVSKNILQLYYNTNLKQAIINNIKNGKARDIKSEVNKFYAIAKIH